MNVKFLRAAWRSYSSHTRWSRRVYIHLKMFLLFVLIYIYMLY